VENQKNLPEEDAGKVGNSIRRKILGLGKRKLVQEKKRKR